MSASTCTPSSKRLERSSEHEERKLAGAESSGTQGPGTVIFDFDSTLISCESLEEIVAPHLEADPELADRYVEITRLGMEGGWTFERSLRERLTIRAPDLNDIAAFVESLDTLWTPGMGGLIADLHERGTHVWIISGGLVEALVPAGAELGIPPDRILGVRLMWDDAGRFAGIDPADPFSRSKVAGVRDRMPDWSSPSVMVGDGSTDRALFEEGLVDAFVAFSQHARRPSVVEGVPEAASVDALRKLLLGYLEGP